MTGRNIEQMAGTPMTIYSLLTFRHWGCIWNAYYYQSAFSTFFVKRPKSMKTPLLTSPTPLIIAGSPYVLSTSSTCHIHWM